MPLHNAPKTQVQMLIRRPVDEVFSALVDPAVTTRFWFTRSSGTLAPGKEVVWEWQMVGVSAVIVVREVDPNRRILIEWGQPPRTVEWLFTARADESTLLQIVSKASREPMMKSWPRRSIQKEGLPS